jgi:hypothetical protein
VKKRRRNLVLVLLLLLAALLGLPSFRAHVYLAAHRHCMKMAGMAFHHYADEHKGEFPKHKDGYGAALLLLPDSYDHCLTGPGYSPTVLSKARTAKRHIREDECGRVYVQGVGQGNRSNIVILFDKLSTPGGDHCHWPLRLWASRGREVLFGDGSMRFVRERDWPTLAAAQIELLVAEGILRAEAERLYAQVVR